MKTQYKKIFEYFLPEIKVQRDKISHEYEHAIKNDLNWAEMWRLVENMAELEGELNSAISHFSTWNISIPKYIFKPYKARCIHSAFIISQSFITLALEIANKVLAAIIVVLIDPVGVRKNNQPSPEIEPGVCRF